ncbi:hypothetical protein ACH4TP_37610 [Streptomyces sp. NPDC021012]|uniref:hypothetical protein n=1 Tax=Streptomyces sp. NPDC021012 TaxID=3365107 RepID=UPI0037B14DDD
MSALIGAGAAVVGGIATGWFTRNAGHKQAAAAEHAGNRQADAVISTVQDTLNEQRRVRAEEQRRQTYAQVLVAGSAYQLNRRETAAMEQAVALVELEGPLEVAEAAIRYRNSIFEGHEDPNAPSSLENFSNAHAAFIRAAQDAIRNA